MSVNTLNKHVLKMLSHLNKYPIPDPQMVKDFNWFIKQYNLSIKSGEVTAPGQGNNTSDPTSYLNNVIFSGLSFAPPFTTIVNATATVLNTPGVPFSDMYSSIPDVIFNSNRVIGIMVSLVNSVNIEPNNTIEIVSVDENGLTERLDVVEIGTIQSGYTYGYVDLLTEDNIYSVDPVTYDIVSSVPFYRGIELTVDNINPTSEYTFQITYYFV